MNFKCRCGKEFSIRTAEDIKDHSEEDGWHITDLTSDYAELLFKIEKEQDKY